MSLFSRILGALGPALASAVRSAAATATRPGSRPPASATARRSGPSRSPGSPVPAPDRGGQAEYSPGRFGPDATAEVDPRGLGPVRTAYSPTTDGDPDPGEIVWTWVPFEEHDGRGKDRPVLVVAAESHGDCGGGTAGSVLVVQLTSKDHQGEDGFVPVGTGGWDDEHRPSWVNVGRVLRVHPGGMRREATALPQAAFERVAEQLRGRYGWQ